VAITRDSEAAELAALYQRAEEKGKAFAAHMEASMPLWAALVDARMARDNFKRDFKVKHMGLKATKKKRPMPNKTKTTITLARETHYEIRRLAAKWDIPVAQAWERCCHYTAACFDELSEGDLPSESIAEIRQADARAEMLNLSTETFKAFPFSVLHSACKPNADVMG
jgi:hypothetical protein